MKNKLVYGLLFSFAVLCGCTGSYDDWADPQGFDAEEAVGISFSAASVASINMANVDTETITVFTPTITAPADASVISYKIILDGKKDLTSDLEGKVVAADLTDAVVDLYGKRPVERVLSAVAYARINQNGVGLYAKSNAFEVKVTLVAPVISSAYYLVGDMLGWDAVTMQKFNHSSVDVYEDPIFTTIFTTTKENQYWKIIPQDNVDKPDGFWTNPGVVGTEIDGDASLTGKLTNTSAKAGKIEKPGMYKMTLNMMDYTYTLQELAFSEFIYAPGNHQAITGTWKPENASALRSPAFDGVYTGYSYLDGSFKFTKARNWDAEYNWNDFTTYSDGFVSDGTNIKMNTAGFYKLEANIPEGKLTATAVTWGIVGPATSAVWDEKAALDMKWNATDESWSITTTLKADELKFVANKGWGINLGGTKDDLSQDGANLKIAEEGTYLIKLFSTRCTSDKMYCTIEKVQ